MDLDFRGSDRSNQSNIINCRDYIIHSLCLLLLLCFSPLNLFSQKDITNLSKHKVHFLKLDSELIYVIYVLGQMCFTVIIVVANLKVYQVKFLINIFKTYKKLIILVLKHLQSLYSIFYHWVPPIFRNEHVCAKQPYNSQFHKLIRNIL